MIAFCLAHNSSSRVLDLLRTNVNHLLIAQLKDSERDEYGYQRAMAQHISILRDASLRTGWMHSSDAGAAAFPEPTSRPVNSFDIFDTILARDVEKPTDIFRIVEEEFPLPYFYTYRRLAEQKAWESGQTLSLDMIYEELTYLIKVNDDTLARLKEYEIQTEIRHCYLITKNYYRVQNGDILVSDMYLPTEVILRMLKRAGFDKSVDIFVTPGGKFQGGWIYDKLKGIFTNIVSHFGDNYGSDVVQAQSHGLRAEHTTLHAPNRFEVALTEGGSRELAQVFRRFRLEYDSNPEGSRASMLFTEQIVQNLPLLLLSAVKVDERMKKENLTRLLLSTRDSCLMEKIMAALYPDIDARRFESSRFMILNPTPAYLEYVREVYLPRKTLVYDLQASRRIFLLISELFNEQPPLQLITQHLENLGTFVGGPSLKAIFDLQISHRDKEFHFEFYSMECRNPDVVGSLSQTYAFASEEDMARILPGIPTESYRRYFLRAPIGYYDVDEARFIHKVVEVFLQFARDTIGIDRLRSLLQSWRGEEACLDMLLRATTCLLGDKYFKREGVSSAERMLKHQRHISYKGIEENVVDIQMDLIPEWLLVGPSLEVALRPYFDMDIDVLVLSESDGETAVLDSDHTSSSCAACRFLQAFMGRQACFFAVSLPRLGDMSQEEQDATLSSLYIGGDKGWHFCERGLSEEHRAARFDIIIREDLLTVGSGSGGDYLEAAGGGGASLRARLKPGGQVLTRTSPQEDGATGGLEESATCFRCQRGVCNLCEGIYSGCVCAFRA